jgi:hypothetical protein
MDWYITWYKVTLDKDASFKTLKYYIVWQEIYFFGQNWSKSHFSLSIAPGLWGVQS